MKDKEFVVEKIRSQYTEAEHTELLRRLVNSRNPSASGEFPGNITLARQYDKIVKLEAQPELGTYLLSCPGETVIPELGMKVICTDASEAAKESLLVHVQGRLTLRSRREGDTITLRSGTKTLKKLFIDKKIPASRRSRIPVIADSEGVVAVLGIGPNQARTRQPNRAIRIEPIINQP